MKGTVLKSTGSHYEVMDENGRQVTCRLRGRIRLKGMRSTNPVAVGDHVLLDEEDGDTLITEILPRENHIIRRSTNLSKETHIIASNLDQVVLMVTLSKPTTSTGFIDRVLITAEAYHIPTQILFNKTDLLDEEGKQRLEELMSLYSAIGYPCKAIQADCIAREELIPIFKDKVSLLTGHSGVGKSTLSNCLQPGLQLRTADVSSAFNKGKHTTTFAEMHPLDIGGYIVDTPGIKGFGMVATDKEDLSHYFLDMRRLIDGCRFNNCQHVKEPGCAIKAAVESGDIANSRYENYMAMYTEDEGPYRKDIYG